METPNTNVLRQLKDIIVQADNLRNSTNFDTDAINFSKYNDELKAYLWKHYDDELVHDRVQKIPHINHKPIQHHLWFWLIMPLEFVYLFRVQKAKQECLYKVEEAKNLYSSILFLLKNA